MVHAKQRIRELDRNGITLMDPRKASVFLISHPSPLLTRLFSGLTAGSGKSIIWYVSTQIQYLWRIHIVNKLVHNSRGEDKMRSRTSPDGLLLL